MKITINADDQYTETEITITCNRLSEDIEKVLAALRMSDMKLTGRREGRDYFLEVSDVIYIESTDKHTFLYTIDKVYESLQRLYELEMKLADRDFLRANKGCLFNINHIESIEPDFDRRLILTMTGGLKLVVSRQYSGLVREKLERNIT